MPDASGRRQILAALALAALAVCFSPPSAHAAGLDNCRLITQDEAAAMLKTPVEPPRDSALGCAWVPKGKTLSYLTVLVTDKKGPAAQTLASSSPDISVRALPGLGDDAAVSLRNGKNVLNLVAQKGGKQVQFNCPFLSLKIDTPRFEQLKALMQKALERASARPPQSGS